MRSRQSEAVSLRELRSCRFSSGRLGGVVLPYGILETLNGNWASVYLVSERRVSAEAASWVLTTFWAMVTIGRMLFAMLSSKVSVRAIYSVSALIILSNFLIIQIVAGISKLLG
jgi:fucose permease